MAIYDEWYNFYSRSYSDYGWVRGPYDMPLNICMGHFVTDFVELNKIFK